MSIGFNGDTFKCRYPAVAGFPQPAFELKGSAYALGTAPVITKA